MGRRPPGSDSLFQTVNNGYPSWCSCKSYTDETGKRRYIRGYGATPTIAIQRRRAKELKLLQAPPVAAKTPTGPTVADITQKWLTRQLSAVKPETYRKYEQALKDWVLPDLGTTPIQALNAEILTNHFYTRLDERNIGSSAKQHTYAYLMNFLNWAVKESHIDKNPLAAVSKPKHKTTVSSNDHKFVERRINVSKGLLKWISEPDNPYHEHETLISTMFLGLRRAETLGLTWDRLIGLDRAGKGTMIIGQQLKRYEKHEGRTGWYLHDDTKSGEERVIHLPDNLRKKLLAHKRATAKIESPEKWQTNLVFKTNRGTNLTYNTYGDIWKNALTDYYNKTRQETRPLTDDEYFRPHAVRHVVASLLFEEGVPLESVQALLGHSQSIMTLYYTHFTKKTRRETANSIDRALNPQAKNKQ
ncbi:tyrosine-type recombinase/integrase [Gordonia amicalis]|uniref:Tyrosine-type recombinase/integrase n=1 Tax=Gordonia amicalis TaxID=89053 RepID=A0ABU4DFT1_9ACTN|nr:tyrosine-type recombinase/integrase [Gordonia amicalis]MDV6308515.1 tyrosine-type recombinase/integrase [Gordonia amicalis]